MATETAAATTSAPATPGAPAARPARRAGRAASGADRVTVALLALAGFLAVLALLAWQLRSTAAGPPARPVIVLRKIYETTSIETVPGTGPNGTSVSQSQSSSGGSYSAAPTTRSS